MRRVDAASRASDEKKLTLNEKSLLKMYNSVIECVKSIKYVYWVKKRLVWACLKGVTL